MGRRISDGKSFKATVPVSTTIVAGTFYELDGVVGIAFESITTDGSTTSNVQLGVEQAEYETSQIDTAQAFAKGAIVYWDSTNDRFTTTALGNRRFGFVSVAKDVNNVVWITRTHLD
jgi:cytoskeletal protein RodZ